MNHQIFLLFSGTSWRILRSQVLVVKLNLFVIAEGWRDASCRLLTLVSLLTRG